jgi:hypothetical protein
MGLVPILNFPADEVVGTLEWSTSWSADRSPVLATGSVEVPQGESIRLTVVRPEGVRRTGKDGWTFQRGERASGSEIHPDPAARECCEDVTLGSPLVEASLKHLPHLAPGLTRLCLANAALGDNALPHIARLTGLTTLQTFGNSFTDDGVQQLISLRGLTHLYLEEETLTVAALAFAIHLPLLEALGIQDVSITDDELADLRASLQGVRVGR